MSEILINSTSRTSNFAKEDSRTNISIEIKLLLEAATILEDSVGSLYQKCEPIRNPSLESVGKNEKTDIPQSAIAAMITDARNIVVIATRKLETLTREIDL